MRARAILWSVPAILYLLFTLWYTNLGGALKPGEIERFIVQMENGSSAPAQVSRLRRFMENDTGRQFLMVNLLDMAEKPRPVDGVPAGGSSNEMMGRYMAHMFPELLKRACHPVFLGNVVFESMDIVGIDGAEQWSSAALMRYRSRRDLLEIATNPVFRGKHEFKMAALDKTIAFPVETQLYVSDPRLLLLLLLFAITALVDMVVVGRHR